MLADDKYTIETVKKYLDTIPDDSIFTECDDYPPITFDLEEYRIPDSDPEF